MLSCMCIFRNDWPVYDEDVNSQTTDIVDYCLQYLSSISNLRDVFSPMNFVTGGDFNNDLIYWKLYGINLLKLYFISVPSKRRQQPRIQVTVCMENALRQNLINALILIHVVYITFMCFFPEHIKLLLNNIIPWTLALLLGYVFSEVLYKFKGYGVSSFTQNISHTWLDRFR